MATGYTFALLNGAHTLGVVYFEQSWLGVRYPKPNKNFAYFRKIILFAVGEMNTPHWADQYSLKGEYHNNIAQGAT